MLKFPNKKDNEGGEGSAVKCLANTKGSTRGLLGGGEASCMSTTYPTTFKKRKKEVCKCSEVKQMK